MSLIDDGAELLASLRPTTTARDVVLKRDALTTSDVSATPSTGGDDTDDRAGGGTTRADVFTFYIAAADYKFDDVAELPLIGDLIVDKGDTYKLLNARGKSPWRWHDSAKLTYEIDTKKQ